MKWFRFYSEVVYDPKVQRLPPDLFKLWINLLCLANDSAERGTLPCDINDLAWTLRLDVDDITAELHTLQGMGLLDWDDEVKRYFPHNWESRQKPSDDVTARVNKHRGKETLQVQQSETLQKRYSNALEERREEEIKKENREEEEERGADKPPAPARVRTRGTTIPPDFTLTLDLKQWAVDEGYSPPLDLDKETKEFIQYWTVGEGQGEKRKNWQLVWQTRMKDRAERLARYGGSKNGSREPINNRSAVTERAIRSLADSAARVDKAADNHLRLLPGSDPI